MVLFLNFYAFFSFNSLVDAFAPATALKNSPSEFIDDFHFTVLHDVVLIAVIQHGCLQRNLQLVHQVLLHFVIQIVDTKLLLNLFDARLGWNNDSLVFFYFVVDIA